MIRRSMATPYPFGTSDAIVFSVFFAVVCARGSRVRQNPGSFFHCRTNGRSIQYGSRRIEKASRAVVCRGIGDRPAASHPAFARVVDSHRDNFVGFRRPFDRQRDVGGHRGGQLFSDGVGEVHAMLAPGGIEHHFVVQVSPFIITTPP